MKCENCGNENIEILNARKGHYLCGKCGRDTEALYEREHDKEIRAKAIEEFSERIKARAHSTERNDWSADYMISIWESVIDEIAMELKGE